MEKGKVIGFTPKALVKRLSKERNARPSDVSFGYKKPNPLKHVTENIQQISDEELSLVVSKELFRRENLTLNDIKHTHEETIKEYELEKETKQKEALQRQKEYNTPIRKYLRLAMLNEDHREERIKKLMEWPLKDLKDILKTVATKTTMREIKILHFAQSREDLIRTIQLKTIGD